MSVISGIYVFHHYKKEKELRVLFLQNHLQNINHYIYNMLDIRFDNILDDACTAMLRDYVGENNSYELRITLISSESGEVLFDSAADSILQYGNHFQRPEIMDALKDGSGTDVRRKSATLGEELFYVATYDKKHDFIVRSAVPYKSTIVNKITSGPFLLWATLLVVILLTIIFYRLLRRMGNTQFATQKLLAHLRIAQEGLAVFDANKRLVFANNLFSRYCDLISVQHLSDIGMLLSQPEFRSIRRFIDSDIVSSKDAEPCFSDKIEKDGRTFSLRCVRFADNSFEISINDITQVEEQTRLKQQLTQNVAHEFKTPVCSIQGYLETIIQNYPHNLTQEQLMHFLQRCYSQSNRLNNLVLDISQLNEMNVPTQQVNKEITDLSLIIRNMQLEINNRLNQQNITVNNQLPERLIMNGDPSMLYSIFRNLFDNAISYAGEGCTITLTCFRTDAQFYYFSFSDNGSGVPEEHLNRIFERFYRVDKGRSRKLGGTGLGLAIVKNAVALHGGTISARQSQEGGLELVFTLRR